MNASTQINSQAQARQIRQQMQSMVESLREEVDETTEPKAQALFETAAEVLEGLAKAFEHYENKSEKAWQ